jgi:uncharacterized protein (TIGR02118 family)
MFKVVTLLKRKPGMDVQEFQDRARTEYGALIASGPGVRRYVLSLPLMQGYSKGELAADAFGEAWFDSEGDWRTFQHSRPNAIARESDILDQERTVELPVDVHVPKDGVIPDNAVKNIEFVNRRPDLDLRKFRDHWRIIHGPLGASIKTVRRYEQNHVAQSAYAAGSPIYDGFAVTWFESTAEMRRGVGTPEYEATRADEPNFIPPGHLPIIITREHVLAG